MYFKSFLGGPDRLMMSVNFFFLLIEKGFLCGCYLICFCCVLFFIQCEYGIGLNVDVPNKSTS